MRAKVCTILPSIPSTFFSPLCRFDRVCTGLVGQFIRRLWYSCICKWAFSWFCRDIWPCTLYLYFFCSVKSVIISLGHSLWRPFGNRIGFSIPDVGGLLSRDLRLGFDLYGLKSLSALLLSVAFSSFHSLCRQGSFVARPESYYMQFLMPLL